MKKKNRQILRVLAWMAFIIYLFFMVYFLFFCEGLGRTRKDSYQYNLEPFAEIKRYISHISELGTFYVMLNLLGNVVCFMPLGFVLPIMSKRRPGVGNILLISFLSSLLVELLQLVTMLGSCDIDDIMMNTFGGLLGYLLFVFCRGFYWTNTKKKKK